MPFFRGGVAAAVAALCLSGAGAKTVVRVGYFTEPQPFLAGAARSWFDTEDAEFVFFPQSSGGHVNARLDGGDLEISAIGSNPLAIGAARGVATSAVYVQYNIGETEALMIRGDVRNPLELDGKVVAVPLTSTAHYHLEYVKALNPTISFTIVGMGPAEMADAYDAGSIDGAYIWSASSAKDHIDATGYPMYTSTNLGAWGKATFMAVVARDDFARDRPDLLSHFLGVYARLDASWNEYFSGGRKDVRWGDADGDDTFLASCVDMVVGSPSMGAPSTPELREAYLNGKPGLAYPGNYGFPGYDAQIDCAAFVGDGDCASAPTSATGALQTADFMLVQKVVASMVPTGRFLARRDPDEHYASAVDGSFLADVGGLGGGSTAPTLDDLLARGAPALPARGNVPSSTCGGTAALVGAGSAGDGANGRAGKIYSAGLACAWTVAAARADAVVEVAFTAFRVWPGGGDAVVVTDAAGDRVATLAGIDADWPPLRGVGGLTVSFTSDNWADNAYGSDYGDGIAFAYGPAPENDCGGGASRADGLCGCPEGFGGGDCSHAHCLGTAVLDAATGSFASHAGALGAGSTYANAADCVFRVVVAAGAAAAGKWVRLEVDYDLEDTFDFLTIAGAPGSDVVLTGDGTARVTVPVGDGGVVEAAFRSDGFGRRSGFRATYEVADAACDGDGDCGHGTCEGGSCACEAGWAGYACDGARCLGAAAGGRAAVDGTAAGAAYSNAGGASAPAQAACVWPIGAGGAGTAVGTRVVFETLDLETYSDSESGPGDYVAVAADATAWASADLAWGERPGDLLLGPVAYHPCDPSYHTQSDHYACDQPWMTRACVRAGPDGARRCAIRRTHDFVGVDSLDVVLRTDRNDYGETHAGVVARWYAVAACPAASGACADVGGSCVDGACYDAEGGANDCSCDEGCPPGTAFVTDAGGGTSCEPCAPGTALSADDVASGLTACQKCDVGYYASAYGSATCDVCAAGSYATDDPTRGAGNASARFLGATDCEPCKAGTFSPSDASFTCNNCEFYLRFTSAPGSPACTMCREGSYLDLSEPPAPSPAGTPSPLPGSVHPDGQCRDCGTSDLKGVDCPPGTNVTTFVIKANYWRRSDGRDDPTAGVAVQKCPWAGACVGTEDQRTPADSGDKKGTAKNAGDDLCAVGHGGRLCTRCEDGYHLSVPAMVCAACSGTGARQKALSLFAIIALCVVLFAGSVFFSRVPAAVANVKSERLKAVAENVRVLPTDVNIISKLLPHPADASLAATSRSDAPVARVRARRSLGPSDGGTERIIADLRHELDLSSLRQRRESKLEAAPPAAAGGGKRRASLPPKLTSADSRPSLSRPQSTGSLKLLPVMESAPSLAALAATMRTACVDVERTVSDAMVILYYRLKIKWRMLVTAMQIVSACTSSFPVRWPPAFRAMLTVLKVFQLDFMAVTPTECFKKTNYYHHLLITTLSPYALLGAVGVYGFFRNGALIRATGKKISKTACFVFLWFFFFPACSATTLKFWYCADGSPNDFENGRSYHVADLALECGTATDKKWEAFAILMVFAWPIGTPLVFFLLVYQYRSRINPLAADFDKMDKPEFNARTKILTDADVDVEKYKMLWLAYKYEHWYFETIVCVQRLLLTSIMQLVYPGTALNVIFVLFVVLVSLKIFTYYEPYMDFTDNDLTEAFHWVFVMLFLASLVMVAGSGTGGMVGDAALLGSLILGLGTCVYMMLYDMHRERRTIASVLAVLRATRRRILTFLGLAGPDVDVGDGDDSAPTGAEDDDGDGPAP